MRLAALLLILLVSPLSAAAQDTEALHIADSATLAAIANQAINEVPATKLFEAHKTPALIRAALSFGTYARGCLAGAQALPVDGPAWQVMRLSRNRNWGHPKLIALLEQLAEDAREKDGWNGL